MRACVCVCVCLRVRACVCVCVRLFVLLNLSQERRRSQQFVRENGPVLSSLFARTALDTSINEAQGLTSTNEHLFPLTMHLYMSNRTQLSPPVATFRFQKNSTQLAARKPRLHGFREVKALSPGQLPHPSFRSRITAAHYAAMRATRLRLEFPSEPPAPARPAGRAKARSASADASRRHDASQRPWPAGRL